MVQTSALIEVKPASRRLSDVAYGSIAPFLIDLPNLRSTPNRDRKADALNVR